MSHSLFSLPHHFPSFSLFASRTVKSEQKQAPPHRPLPSSLSSPHALDRLRDLFSFIFDVSDSLRLPLRCPLSALTVLQEFFHKQPKSSHPPRELAITALFLCSKIEECPRKLSDFVSFYHSRHPEFELEAESELRERVLTMEQEMLLTLDFQLDVQTPMDHLLFLMRSFFGFSSLNASHIARTAMKLLVLSYCSNVQLLFSAQAIATAILFLSSELLKINVNEMCERTKFLSNDQKLPWWSQLSELKQREFSALIDFISKPMDHLIAEAVFPGFGESIKKVKSEEFRVQFLSELSRDFHKRQPIVVKKQNQSSQQQRNRWDHKRKSLSRSPSPRRVMKIGLKKHGSRSRSRSPLNRSYERNNQQNRNRGRSRSKSPTNQKHSRDRDRGRDRDNSHDRYRDHSFRRNY
jgi:hypothetical protein